MKPDLLQWLCCPACDSELTIAASHIEQDGSIGEGVLICRGCGAGYPIRNGVPRFVDTDAYVRSFSYEWNKWDRVQLDVANNTAESEQTFIDKTGFTRGDLTGRLVLDGGCGSGRFLDVVSRWGARVVGVDFSYAVDAAQANVGGRPNVDVVQADLFRLPFKKGVFDAVFSIGVLHHTPDTRAAFLKLPPLLKERGEIAVWLYHYPDRLYCKASDFWRAVFRHVPHRLLFAWCWVLVVLLSGLYRKPFMSRAPWRHVRRVLPVNTHPDFHWRVLDTFDWYSPRYQDKDCSILRTLGWFREAGLRYFDVLDYPTAIRGLKTSDPSVPEFRTPIIDIRAKRILLFGAGAGGAEAFAELRRRGLSQQVTVVCDNNPAKAGTTFHGQVVRPFADVPREDYDVVIVASLPGRAAISAQLTAAGLLEKQDFATLNVATEFATVLAQG